MMKLFVAFALVSLCLSSVEAFTSPPLRIHHVAVKSVAVPRVRAFSTTTDLSASTLMDPDNGSRFIQEGRRIQQERRQQVRDRGTIRLLYAAATGLCIQMATEILISPRKLLPGALWAALIPFQLNSNFRKTHPKTYKAMGFACVGASVSMTVGILNLLQESLAMTGPFQPLAMNVLLLSWFVYTSTKTFQLTLRSKSESSMSRADYAHQRWMLRHVGSGLWIALQPLLRWSVGSWWTMMSLERQRSLVALAVRVGALATIGASEYVVSIMKRQKHGYRGETVDLDIDDY